MLLKVQLLFQERISATNDVTRRRRHSISEGGYRKEEVYSETPPPNLFYGECLSVCPHLYYNQCLSVRRHF